MQYPSPKGRVSIHAPAWGATAAWRCRPRWLRCFNPRTRVGCDRISDTQIGTGVLFQSTHPRGVRPPARAGPRRPCGGFNPRTRVGCDRSPVVWARMARLFQSTHPRGVRPWMDRNFGCAAGFQSTHPRGVRPALLFCWLWIRSVSIHAPAWGATPPPPRRPRLISMFQSTHPRGVRHGASPQVSSFRKFQSTHPRGVRRDRQKQRCAQRSVSIHAPAWGATPGLCFLAGANEFQSTHPRGVRPCPAVPLLCRPSVSIHAPAWGATG